MIICGSWFCVEKKTKTHPNTKFLPIFNGRNNKTEHEENFNWVWTEKKITKNYTTLTSINQLLTLYNRYQQNILLTMIVESRMLLNTV